MFNWFAARVTRPFNGGKTVFSIIGARETGYLNAKEWCWTLHYIQKSTQMGHRLK